MKIPGWKLRVISRARSDRHDDFFRSPIRSGRGSIEKSSIRSAPRIERWKTVELVYRNKLESTWIVYRGSIEWRNWFLSQDELVNLYESCMQ